MLFKRNRACANAKIKPLPYEDNYILSTLFTMVWQGDVYPEAFAGECLRQWGQGQYWNITC